MKMNQDANTPYMAVLNAVILPIIVTGILSTVIPSLAGTFPSLNFLTTNNGVTLAGLGLTALYLGKRWYGNVEKIGLRNGRPFMAGVGFAFLGWVGLLIARFLSVGIVEGSAAPNLGITYLFLLIFEAFCVQLWTYGLLFRTVAEWRNPISAVLYSGILYGFTAYYLYTITFDSRLSLLYYVVLGIFYGMIRLRTGSFLGIVFIQALQTLTVWYLLQPTEPISLSWLYGLSCTIYLIITWRLLPKYVSDFRV